jgi:hypothetical protein
MKTLVEKEERQGRRLLTVTCLLCQFKQCQCLPIADRRFHNPLYRVGEERGAGWKAVV